MTVTPPPFVPSVVEGSVRVGDLSFYQVSASTSLGTNGI